jgi:DNA polymerase-1
MKTSTDIPIGGLFGFIRTIFNLIEKHKVEQIVIALDSGKKTFRSEIYEAYKANRVETPQNMIPQFAILQEFLDCSGLANIKKDGFEADDIIASIVTQKRGKFSQGKFSVVTSDKDLMQLVCENVNCVDIFKDKVFETSDVIEKFGIEPQFIVDYLSLLGDASDNIPGVKGCGAKGAVKLINAFGTLEEIIANAEKIPNGKLKDAIQNYSQMGILSKQLASLNYDVEIENSLNFGIENINFEEITKFLEKYEMKSLMYLPQRLAKRLNENPEEQPQDKVKEKPNAQFQLI